MTKNHPPSKRRTVLRWTLRAALAIVLLLVVAVIFLLRVGLYHRFVSFPRQEKAWAAIRELREDVTLENPWQDYRGVCHSHSELSHDCDVPFTEILEVLKETDRDFICMSDHCHEGRADYGAQWKGLRDGKLFVRGYEMSGGFMPWGLPDDTVLDCGETPEKLAKQIEAAGGLLFIAHSEEPREWQLPQIAGMEIYNIHTDFKDEDLAGLFADILLNIKRYPDQTMRLLFDRQDKILAHWDELSRGRQMVSIAANDCHQNNGVVATYTQDATLLLRTTSPDTIGEFELNFLTRLPLRILFGPLEAGRTLFHIQPDPYDAMVRHVSTHILAAELSEVALLDALRAGRVFIAFDSIADATGFTWQAESGAQTAVMGEEIPLAPGLLLRAASPLPCRFTVMADGQRVHEETGRSLDYKPDGRGKYRVEAELNIHGEWVPWVYTNPIEVR